MTSSAVDVANDEDADMREEDEDDEDNANPSGSDLPQSSSATPAGIGRALQTRHYNPAGPESSGDLPEFGELERRGEEKVIRMPSHLSLLFFSEFNPTNSTALPAKFVLSIDHLSSPHTFLH